MSTNNARDHLDESHPDYEEPLLGQKRPAPLTAHFTTQEERALRKRLHAMSISYSIGATYAMALSLAALVLVGVVLGLSSSLSVETRVWLVSIIGVCIVSLQIMVCVYGREPIFAIHFIAALMLATGVAFTLSSVHLLPCRSCAS